MERKSTIQTQPETIADSTLMQEALEGSEQAFANLVDRYSDLLLHVISHYVGDDDTACDVLQQVFLQLYLSLSSIRMESPLKPWLIRVARSRSIDELRRRRRTPLPLSLLETGQAEGETFIPLEHVDPDPQPEQLIEQCELQSDLQQAIATLPSNYRRIVWLRYWEELSFAEIGRVLGIPATTAKTSFFRAKSLLRTTIAKLNAVTDESAFPSRYGKVLEI